MAKIFSILKINAIQLVFIDLEIVVMFIWLIVHFWDVIIAYWVPKIWDSNVLIIVQINALNIN